MSLTTAAIATLGGRRYETHASSVRVWLGLLPTPNRAEVVLPAAAGAPSPGDDAILELDGGDAASGASGGSETVLTGTVSVVRRSADWVTVTVTDAGARLAAVRPGSTADRQDAGAVVRSIASAAKVDVGDLDLDLGLATYVADQRRTGAEHAARLADLGGCIARVDADGHLALITRPAGPPDVALQWGRELSDYQVLQRPAPTSRTIRVGSGSAGSPDADNALRPTTDPLRGDASGPAADTVLEAAPLLRSAGVVSTAGAAEEDAADARALTLRAVCSLQPALRPGVVIQVADVPDGLDAGPWLLIAVVHTLDPHSGGRTTFEAEHAGAGGPGGSGLLAMAAGAVGSLL
jgi:hypothetical protein